MHIHCSLPSSTILVWDPGGHHGCSFPVEKRRNCGFWVLSLFDLHWLKWPLTVLCFRLSLVCVFGPCGVGASCNFEWCWHACSLENSRMFRGCHHLQPGGLHIQAPENWVRGQRQRQLQRRQSQRRRFQRQEAMENLTGLTSGSRPESNDCMKTTWSSPYPNPERFL